MNALFQVRTLELIRLTGDWRAILLVLLVETVIIPVTNPVLWNAVSRSRTGELVVGASFFGTRIPLVGTVSTVVFRIALPGEGYATSVAAVELRAAAGDVYAAGFVAKVAAVVF